MFLLQLLAYGASVGLQGSRAPGVGIGGSAPRRQLAMPGDLVLLSQLAGCWHLVGEGPGRCQTSRNARASRVQKPVRPKQPEAEAPGLEQESVVTMSPSGVCSPTRLSPFESLSPQQAGELQRGDLCATYIPGRPAQLWAHGGSVEGSGSGSAIRAHVRLKWPGATSRPWGSRPGSPWRVCRTVSSPRKTWGICHSSLLAGVSYLSSRWTGAFFGFVPRWSPDLPGPFGPSAWTCRC